MNVAGMTFAGKDSTMKRMTPPLALLAALAGAALPATARAQNVVFHGPGGGNVPPAEMTTHMRALDAWHSSHKNVLALEQTLNGLMEMPRRPQTQFRRDQARAFLAVLRAWRNKPVMTDREALRVSRQLTEPLTIPQLKRLASAAKKSAPPVRRPRGGGGPQGPGGSGGVLVFRAPSASGGGGTPPAAQRIIVPGNRLGATPRPLTPREYNPLNPDTLPFEPARPAARKRLAEFMAILEARAKQSGNGEKP
jgi:hypothetical protein